MLFNFTSSHFFVRAHTSIKNIIQPSHVQIPLIIINIYLLRLLSFFTFTLHLHASPSQPYLLIFCNQVLKLAVIGQSYFSIIKILTINPCYLHAQISLRTLLVTERNNSDFSAKICVLYNAPSCFNHIATRVLSVKEENKQYHYFFLSWLYR